MSEKRQELVGVVRGQAAASHVCDAAEMALLGTLLRDRLSDVGVTPSPDVAIALMAVAMLLAGEAPEFGGDARDALGAVAALGLELLEDTTEAGGATTPRP